MSKIKIAKIASSGKSVARNFGKFTKTGEKILTKDGKNVIEAALSHKEFKDIAVKMTNGEKVNSHTVARFRRASRQNPGWMKESIEESVKNQAKVQNMGADIQQLMNSGKDLSHEQLETLGFNKQVLQNAKSKKHNYQYVKRSLDRGRSKTYRSYNDFMNTKFSKVTDEQISDSIKELNDVLDATNKQYSAHKAQLRKNSSDEGIKELFKQHKSNSKDKSFYWQKAKEYKIPQAIIGGAFVLGLGANVTRASNDRGQQSNAQLYGQQSYYR